jgi:signal transduction histidine kinase/DNA-binding response OmpR family regulator
MSKKKLPNLLNSRLDSLLVDLEQETAYLPSLVEKPLSGWAWECDLQGVYTSIGKEVERTLGVPREDFIGQPLFGFQIEEQSKQVVESTLLKGNFPVDVRVVFLDQVGKPVPALLHILATHPPPASETTRSLRGFVQIIADLSDLPQTHPSAPGETGKEEGWTGSLSSAPSQLTPVGMESLNQGSLITRPGEGHLPAVMAVPFHLPDKKLGLLEILDDNPGRHWTKDERKLVEQVAAQLSQTLETAYLYQETRQRVQELDLLFGVSQSLSGASMESGEIASIIAGSLAEVMKVPRISVLLKEPEPKSWRVLADFTSEMQSGGENELLITSRVGTQIPFYEYPDLTQMAATPQPLQVSDRDQNISDMMRRHMQINESQFLLFLPLVTKGHLIGVVEMGTADPDYSYTPSQFNLSSAVVNAAAVALENARLYEQQRQAAEKLREVDKLKSQFLANMSHELRTPLNSIIGFSRVILKGIDGPLTDLQQEDLSAIHNSGTHLLNLINNVLDISKIEAGKMELVFEENIDLVELIESVIATTYALVKDKPITLEKHIQPDLPLVKIDTTRIRQVMLNLLSNAVKFTEQGKIILEAYLHTDETGRPEVLVKVTDSGIGISSENQYKLFQPFSQVDESPTRKAGGSGLGLSISRLLVEMHGGRIGVSSEVGTGSTFFFTLPIRKEAGKEEGKYEKKLILAIDDDSQILNLYERYLNNYGYRVHPCTEPRQAFDLINQVKPYAIILDLIMPEMDGWQVLEELKKNPDSRNVPVIICSILEDEAKGFSLGAADFLTKPILEGELLKVLNSFNGDGSIRKILVVDDDPVDLSLLRNILKDHYQVRTARGGLEGLAALQEQPPGAVILDLFMPEVDGFVVLENMRSNPHLRDVPVIVFTEDNISAGQRQKIESFSTEMLNKHSFQEEELLKVLERAIQRCRSSSQ